MSAPEQGQIPALEKPFENIALAFSGGGFRAAAFALGTLSYMNKVKFKDKTLLEKVTYLSSASGGTIATALYSLNSAEGKPFSAFYKKLFENMEGVKLVEEALKLLNDKNEWKEPVKKRRNLINAFALAYDKLLFDRKHLSALKESNKTHLEEVCFNATEFYHGLLFRQTIKLKLDTKSDSGFLFGNFIVRIDHSTAADLKLADLLAASSCFPSGFEPIIFPDDFINANADRAALLKGLAIELQPVSEEELNMLYSEKTLTDALTLYPDAEPINDFVEEIKKKPLKSDFVFGLMDGGITDNQGTESLIRANQRRLDNETDFKPFDLMIINDVGSHFMSPYKLPKKLKTHGLSVNTLIILSIIAITGGLALMGYGICQPNQSSFTVISGILGLIFFLSGSLTITIVLMVRQLIKGKLKSGKGLDLSQNFSERMVNFFFRFFSSTPLMVIWRMLNERFNSVLTLNNDVFLKRIRHLLYQQFFEKEKWTGRIKSNHIYDLSFSNDTNRMRNDDATLAPGRRIQLVAEGAFDMDTTLWFDAKNKEQHKQAAIIATGQFTTCYNLLEYISRLKKDNMDHEPDPERKKNSVYDELDPERKKEVDDIQQMLYDHYKQFQDNPFWLYNELGTDFNITGFKPKDANQFKMPEKFNSYRKKIKVL